MPQLRIDPIVGRRVYIAEDRAGRPHDYDEASGEERIESLAARREHCPFCAGHEQATPDAVAETRTADGRWLVRVVPNKYPAVGAAGDERGVHEVVVESSRHVADVADLEPDELAAMIRMHRDRLRACGERTDLAAAVVFKNAGHRAGASLEHIHSQLVALPYVPELLAAETSAARRHHERESRCVFCELVARERAAGQRVILDEGGMLAVAAFAGRQPYETWILPTDHAADFRRLADDACTAAGQVLQRVLAALASVAPGAAYNLMLHTAPFHDAAADWFHWHWELVPRIAHFAGLELGAGVYINPLAPERAATFLRDAL